MGEPPGGGPADDDVAIGQGRDEDWRRVSFLDHGQRPEGEPAHPRIGRGRSGAKSGHGASADASQGASGRPRQAPIRTGQQGEEPGDGTRIADFAPNAIVAACRTGLLRSPRRRTRSGTGRRWPIRPSTWTVARRTLGRGSARNPSSVLVEGASTSGRIRSSAACSPAAIVSPAATKAAMTTIAASPVRSSRPISSLSG